MATILKVQGLGEEKVRSWLIGLGIGVGILIILIILLNSPIFSLKTFEVEGNNRVSDETIMDELGLSYGQNLFRYAVSHLGKTPPTVDSRLSSVDVYFDWPSTVRVEVEESETIGYVYFQGTYLCIDQKGQVASSTNQPDDDLPIIIGLTVGNFSIGEPLALGTGDGERYEAVMSIGSNLRKYGISEVVKEINIRNLEDIILTTNKLVCHCGSMTDMGQKINVIAELSRKAGVPRGILHIESMSDQIYIETEQSGGKSVGE
ncbi:MAG: FtsQ-type POTRA domain-containing protein [Firmicutes bacterium]|nr:FtsQ-type POTRA domain-containing protein [Bacillota bacterium]